VEHLPKPSEEVVSFGIVRAVLGELRRRQLDLDGVLLPTGLREAELCLPQMPFIPLSVAQRCITAAQSRCNDPTLGLTLGAQAAYAPASVLAPLIASCNTLREAISELQRYEALLASSVHFGFAETRSEAELSLNFLADPPQTRAATFLRDYIIAALLSIGRQFSPTRSLQGVRVRFRGRAPSHAPRIVALLGCELAFLAEVDAISFPARSLDRPQSHADCAMRKAYRELAEVQLRLCSDSRPTAERLRRFLTFQRSFSAIDAQYLARILGISTRSLRRKLEQESATVRQLLDEARRRAALQDLTHHASVIKELSERLGFSDTTAFHRAFRRWTGHTPTQFKRRTALERVGTAGLPPEGEESAPPTGWEE
jgi:AraC-like DNA-binding protein